MTSVHVKFTNALYAAENYTDLNGSSNRRSSLAVAAADRSCCCHSFGFSLALSAPWCVPVCRLCSRGTVVPS
jgi:hypothetical protein